MGTSIIAFFLNLLLHDVCVSSHGCRCKERFYDEKALSQHYSRTHFCCHICDKLQRPNKWFRDYQVCYIVFLRVDWQRCVSVGGVAWSHYM